MGNITAFCVHVFALRHVCMAPHNDVIALHDAALGMPSPHPARSGQREGSHVFEVFFNGALLAFKAGDFQVSFDLVRVREGHAPPCA